VHSSRQDFGIIRKWEGKEDEGRKKSINE